MSGGENTENNNNKVNICISVVPVLSTGTKIITVPTLFIPVPVLELELELEHNFAFLKTGNFIKNWN